MLNTWKTDTAAARCSGKWPATDKNFSKSLFRIISPSQN
jgi:hypothetical protein